MHTKFFNTTGPCNPADHYMLPPEERLVGAQLHRYIRDKLYWVLHAPRQTGKTTFLKSWMREINSGAFSGEDAVACYVNIEACQGMLIEDAMLTLCSTLRTQAARQNMLVPELSPNVPPGNMLNIILSNWASLVAPQSLVVLFDEVDVLEDAAMVSFLRQLRSGFGERGIGSFPVSIALVGMRDLKDYLVSAKDGKPVNPGSPFNIKEDSAEISNFTQEDIA
ncbi:MAG: ATP-binding protein, partial [Treponema sp.]|nr:ATP-binding protein [Treponema sp.]